MLFPPHPPPVPQISQSLRHIQEILAYHLKGALVGQGGLEFAEAVLRLLCSDSSQSQRRIGGCPTRNYRGPTYLGG